MLLYIYIQTSQAHTVTYILYIDTVDTVDTYPPTPVDQAFGAKLVPGPQRWLPKKIVGL